MCLYNKTGVIEVAEKDIVCYKIVGNFIFKTFIKKFGRKKYFSPYQLKEISRKVISGKTNMIAEGDVCIIPTKYSYSEFYEIGEGYIHTFANENDALKMFEDHYFSVILEEFSKDYELYQCVIPKGTQYFKGVNAAGIENYASREIKFIKKIK